MATGWAREGAVLDQIEDTITDGVLTARARLPVGEGAEQCVECGETIPEARRKALPGARTCVHCQSGRDRRLIARDWANPCSFLPFPNRLAESRRTYDMQEGAARFSGALEPVLEPWWQSFSGPFLYYPGRRLVPAPLRAFIDFIKTSAGHADR